MPIPEWMKKWIEQPNNRPQNIIALTEEENRVHTDWCSLRLGDECNCQQEHSTLANSEDT